MNVSSVTRISSEINCDKKKKKDIQLPFTRKAENEFVQIPL